MSNAKDGGYDSSLIDEIVSVIKGEDGKEIDTKDFNRIQSAVKDFHWYERDDIEFDEVLEYCNWGMDSWEREQILDELEVSDNNNLDVAEMISEVEINTLDDEYRMELLLKMYKMTSNLEELENMVRGSVVTKMCNVIL